MKTMKKYGKVKTMKVNVLKDALKKHKSAVIAFSGGVDSTFLLKVASLVLEKKNVLAVIAKSETYPESEFKEALSFVKNEKIEHIVIQTSELDIKGFSSNPIDRCYYCKKELFSELDRIRKEKKFGAVMDGTNYDDRLDVRYGTKAAKELGVISPLGIAKMTKQDIRIASKNLGLKTHDKPSFACLASRFPYNAKITASKLTRVDKAEQYLRKKGFKQVRVRDYDAIARIELYRQDIKKAIVPRMSRNISAYFKSLGYKYITIDLEGYRTGSMNL